MLKIRKIKKWARYVKAPRMKGETNKQWLIRIYRKLLSHYTPEPNDPRLVGVVWAWEHPDGSFLYNPYSNPIQDMYQLLKEKPNALK